MIPLSRAFVYIFLSVIVITGPALLGLLYYQSFQAQRSKDDQYLIRTIAHSNELPLEYLYQLLGFSEKEPKNLYQVHTSELEKKLLQSPLIKEARVKKMVPNKLFIDYRLRKPIARISDYKDVAIDQDYYLFPSHEQSLPSYYLGEEMSFEEPIKGKKIQLAKKLHKLITKHFSALHLNQIDVSKIDANSSGQRQIVITLNDALYLRLSEENFAQELANFSVLFDSISPIEGACVIDLRCLKIALIQPQFPFQGFHEKDLELSSASSLQAALPQA